VCVCVCVCVCIERDAMSKELEMWRALRRREVKIWLSIHYLSIYLSYVYTYKNIVCIHIYSCPEYVHEDLDTMSKELEMWRALRRREFKIWLSIHYLSIYLSYTYTYIDVYR